MGLITQPVEWSDLRKNTPVSQKSTVIPAVSNKHLDESAGLKKRKQVLRSLDVRQQLFAKVIQLLADLVVGSDLIFVCDLNSTMRRLQTFQLCRTNMFENNHSLSYRYSLQESLTGFYDLWVKPQRASSGEFVMAT